MLNMPILKFEKSTNYLNSQLELQLNNKQLVSDIISNISLILANVSNDNKLNYIEIQNSANTFLQNISQNITTIEELKREIKHITYDLTEILSEASRKEKSKEYYITAISSVKNNIEQYTVKFQNIEKKLEQDNIDFNEFIKINNFKYNFVSNKDDNTYEFSSFSIDNQTFSNEPQIENTLQNKKEKKIDELTNEFKAMLSSLSEDTVLKLTSLNSLTDEFINTPQTEVEEAVAEEPIVTTDETATSYEEKADISTTIENNLSNLENTPETIVEDNEDDEAPNLVIDYASIYGNYYNRVSNIEEDIYNEYSGFSSVNTQPSNNNLEDTSANKKEETSEFTDEDILNEIIDDVSDEDLLNEIIDDVSDEDLLAELLISDSVTENMLLNDTTTNSETTTEKANNIDESSTKIVVEEKVCAPEASEEAVFPEKGITEETTQKNKPTKINYNNFSNYDLEEKLRIIKEASTNNDTLIISEKQNKIFLPYTIDELEKYLKSYPEVYTSLADVVEQEFILPFDTFLKHPAKSRFSETYNLIKNRQGKSIFSALIYAFKLLGRYNLNPAIIAACKTEHQLDSYLYYLNSNNLNEFKLFKIIYEINPL